MIIDEELRNVLEEKLFIKEFLSPEDEKRFFEIMAKYLLNRSTIETFLKNLDETIKFYEIVGVSYDKMLMSIMKWPAIIHADKDDLFYKYLLLACISNINTGECDRENILIEHPKDFMTGFDTLYGRIMFLQSGSVNLKNEYITRRKVLKTTNVEFEEIYGISKNELLKRYPLGNSVIEKIKSWDVNKELVKEYESKGFRKRAS